MPQTELQFWKLHHSSDTGATGICKIFSHWRAERPKDKSLSCLDITLKITCWYRFVEGRFKLSFEMQTLQSMKKKKDHRLVFSTNSKF